MHALLRALETDSCFSSIKVSKGKRDLPFLLHFLLFFFLFVSFLNISCQVGISPFFFTPTAQFYL